MYNYICKFLHSLCYACRLYYVMHTDINIFFVFLLHCLITYFVIIAITFEYKFKKITIAQCMIFLL